MMGRSVRQTVSSFGGNETAFFYEPNFVAFYPSLR